MADAWIESHQMLARHRKTRALARILGIGRPQAVGHLHFLWWWAIDYASDGSLSEFHAVDIAEEAGWEGDDPDAFVSALKQSGFMDANGALHDWHEYAGKLLERRKTDRERKRNPRSEGESSKPPQETQRSSDGVPVEVLRNSDRTVQNQEQEPTSPKPRGRRVIKDSPEFARFWAAYPIDGKAGKGGVRAHWAKAVKVEDPEVLIDAAARYAADPNRDPDFTLGALRWLREGHWDDPPLRPRTGGPNALMHQGGGLTPAGIEELIAATAAQAKGLTDGRD